MSEESQYRTGTNTGTNKNQRREKDDKGGIIRLQAMHLFSDSVVVFSLFLVFKVQFSILNWNTRKLFMSDITLRARWEDDLNKSKHFVRLKHF